MLVHIIVDYSFLYYKYKFQLDSGRMKRLTAPINWKGAVIEKDISQIYYSIKEIEGFRRKLEIAGHDIIISVCFDMPSDRKNMSGDTDVEEAASKYKANRVKHLSDEDHENILFVEKMLSDVGYNTYRFDRYESDDIIAHLVANYKREFGYNIIYTPDLDILANIDENVGACRYKALHGYKNVDINNFSEYLSSELKCNMHYNGLMLYKSTVGDKSDCIDGIKKFGPKAFNKLVEYLDNKVIYWPNLKDWRATENILAELINSGYFTQEQGKQALSSLSMVRPMIFDNEVVTPPVKKSNRDMREAVYMQFGMKTLVD